MTTTHRLGHTFAQQVATGLVEHGLRAIWTDPVVVHGDEFYAKDVRNLHRPGSIDGLVTFAVYSDAHGGMVDVTVMVSASERVA